MKISFLLAAFVLTSTVACGAQNSGSNPTPTAAPTASATVVATPTPGSGAVLTLSPGASPPNLPFPFTPGLPIPDVVRDVVLNVATSNIDGLVALAKAQQIACTTAQGAGGPPKCKPGDSPGTTYTVFPTGSCQGEWSTDARAAISSLFAQPVVLYAAVDVKAPNPDPEPSWPKGQHAVMFSANSGGPTAGIYFILDGTNIIRAHAICGTGAGAELKVLRDIGTTSFLIPPK